MASGLPTMFNTIGSVVNTLRKPVGAPLNSAMWGGLNKINGVVDNITNPGMIVGKALGKTVGKAIFPPKNPTSKTVGGLPIKETPNGKGNVAVDNGQYVTPKTPGLINKPAPMASTNSAPAQTQTFQSQPNQPMAPTTQPTPTPQVPNAFSTNIQSLTNYGQGQESPQLTKARQDLLDFQKEKANQTREINTGGTWTSRATGQQHQADIQNAATEQALQTAINTAQSSQGQQIGAAGTAGGLAQPVGQFGVLTNPQTGQPVNGQSATQAAQYGGYVQGLQSGAQALGAVGGTTNAANASNAGTQAFGVNLALGQVSSLAPVIKNFLSQTGINPSDAQIYNAPISTYLGKIQASGQLVQWNTLMSELNRYSSQLIGTGALTPTGVTEATQLQNPSQLSLAQIDGVLRTLSDVGNNQVYNLQQQTNLAAPGNSIYTGTPAAPVSSTKPAPVASSGTPGAGITSPAGQFGAGVTLNAGSWGLEQLKNIGAEVFSFLVGKFL